MGLYRVRTTFTGLGGSPYLMTNWFWDSTSSQANAAAAVTKATNFVAAGAARISNLVTWATQSNVDEFDLSGELTSFWTVSQAGMNGAGTQTGEPLPTANNGLLRLETGVVLGGKRFRGRLFLPAPTETNNGISGAPDSAYRTSWNTALTSLLAAGAPTACVWSRRYAAQATIVSGATQSYWAILRSRRD